MDKTSPFKLEYSPQTAVLLDKLGISVALSTYQAGKVVLINSFDEDHLIQLPRTYKNAMGMAYKDGKLAIASERTLEVLKNAPQLAPMYPKKKDVYDAIYMPRASYHTGYLALHDMAFLNNKLVAVNTLFSCLSYIDEEQNFTPFWQPPFISELEPEDRCHLNGLAIENEEIKYLTALGKTDVAGGWRENKMNGGILMEYPSGKIILENLAMPHSPRIYNGKLYILNSAQGELIEVNPETGTYEVVVNLGGFARGMDYYEDYLFIGVSKLRHNSPVFRDLPIAETSFAGVIIVYLPYKSIVGQIKYAMSVDEIYDVKVLPNQKRANILSPDMDILKAAITFNDKYYWGEVISEEEAQKQQNQSHNVSPYQNSVHIRILTKLQPSAVYEQFEPLLCKELQKKLKEHKITNALNLIVATINNNPIGMIVFASKTDRSSRIYTVFVKKDFRNKGIAKGMLKFYADIMSQNNITYIEAAFNAETLEINQEIIRRLFAKYPNMNLIFE